MQCPINSPQMFRQHSHISFKALKSKQNKIFTELHKLASTSNSQKNK